MQSYFSRKYLIKRLDDVETTISLYFQFYKDSAECSFFDVFILEDSYLKWNIIFYIKQKVIKMKVWIKQKLNLRKYCFWFVLKKN